MTKYRKLPVEIDAIQFTGTNWNDLTAFFGSKSGGGTWQSYTTVDGQTVLIYTSEGRMEGRVGDWIIKGVAGEFYPCKPDIFAKTYERVSPLP